MPVGSIDMKQYNEDTLFSKLIDFDNKEYSMCVSIMTESDLNLEETVGLLTQHAYTLLGAYEVDGHKLLKIRNPWGKCEWTGKWSDEDSSWTQEMKDELNVVVADDGIFYMEIGDFVHYFEIINVVYYNEKLKYIKTIDLAIQNNQIEIRAKLEGEVVITLIQKIEKLNALRTWTLDLDDNLIGGESGKTFNMNPTVKGENMTVVAGEYKIIADMFPGKSAPNRAVFNMMIRSDHEASIQSVTDITNENEYNYFTREELANVIRCDQCKKPIAHWEMVQCSVGTFHQKCFVCEICGEPLVGSYTICDGKKTCQRCAENPEEGIDTKNRRSNENSVGGSF
ncbi:hypothetical protein EIN_234550 [Entamoeba invadens IP1]|uniref:Calpain catalytic domain-containing protein n=1 Tax=Entamoeba invadens IP1 TaxID=370355 RepID=L7FM96_ENTIV|nr:hypothetical protein EIN_234550 [Entamoeba invadens IP1]ELP86008.1 hypothetical protein EIN_234550 [Entamoeba invadens IP1]|eukprot:XP_004185354.1 hypothetical protein EIN_234550 [Entamoeba invadens IP1]